MQANKEPSENDLKLELVQVLFRHGVRTPLQVELNMFQFNDTSAYGTWGDGQLTNAGKKQEYEFGLFLRKRYNLFLNERYTPEEVYAYSTDTDRTKMSLGLVYAGLYPPVNNEIWNPNLIWSPIPYTLVPTEFDILMYYNYYDSRCKKLRVEAYKSEKFRKKITKHSNFLSFLTAETKVDFIDNFVEIILLSSLLEIHEEMNLSFPDWYKPEMKEKLRELVVLVLDGFALVAELNKHCVGFLIKTLIENMNLKGRNINTRKIYLYSGHDSNIGMFTRSHKIENFRYPDFGCSLILEKLRDSHNQVYVRLLGRTGSGTIVTLKLGSFKEFCPIDEYLKIVEPVIPSESEVDEMLGVVSIAKLRKTFFSDPLVKKSQKN